MRYTPLVRPDAAASRGGMALAALGSAACVAATLAVRYQRSRLCLASSSAERLGDDIEFGDLQIGASHVLLSSAHAVAFRELQPIVPGHCVVAPRRRVARVSELSDQEWLELWRTVRQAQAAVEGARDAPASNLLLKDGTARLTHIHAHVVPRLHLDFARNDAVFDAMDAWVPSQAAAARLRPALAKLELPSDAERKDRTPATMADEAASYRKQAGAAGASGASKALTFSRFHIAPEHTFYDSASGLTVGFVNLRPLVPGHVLVTPRRIVPRIADLTDAEVDDMWASVRAVQSILQARYQPRGFEIGVQDGKLAGQSVPHVHVHVLPHP